MPCNKSTYKYNVRPIEVVQYRRKLKSIFFEIDLFKDAYKLACE